MPAGSVALAQLAAYGAESQYLTGNPQMTYFKLVFRRYTNFALDSREMVLTGPTTLLGEETITLKTVIPRHGDLLSALYLLVDLPDIYSGYRDNSGADPEAANAGYRFQWIHELGARLVERVDVSVGGTKVHELWGDWMYLWYELFAPDAVDLQTYDELIGNTPAFYDPAHGPGRLGVYPTATLDPVLDEDPELTTDGGNLDVLNPYLRTASIRGQTLYIPLPFWFGTHSGLSLPLIALQAHEVEVTVTLRRLNDLYTVEDTDPASATYGQRIRPSDARDDTHMTGFLANVRRDGFGTDASTEQLFARTATATVNKLDVNPRLQGTYTLLDKEERKRFAAVSHEYLVEQVVRREFLGVRGDQLLDLTLNHPVKTLTWYAQHSDVDKTNDWCNYRNWRRYDPSVPASRVALSGNGGQRDAFGRTGAEVPPYALQAYQPASDEILSRLLTDGTATTPLAGPWVRRRGAAAAVTPLTRFQYPRTEPDILVSTGLLFDGNARVEVRPPAQFTHLEALQHRFRRRRPGVYTYSFSLEPRHQQPAGACNMSRIQNVQLDVQTLPQPADEDAPVEYKVVVYAVNYNVFRILGGMGSVAFQNG